MKEIGDDMNYLSLFLKGVVIGLFMLVPGISGGSIAILLNLYDELLINLNDIFKTFKKSFKFLFIVLLGGVLGVIISSFLLDFVISNFYFEIMYLFVGIMIHYLLFLLGKRNRYSFLKKLFLIMIGITMGLLLTMLPGDLIKFNNQYTELFLLGIFLAIALILPGVSVSYVLLLFSLYDDVLIAIQMFDYVYLLKMGIFLIIGMFLVVKFLHYLIVNKKDTMEFIIVGFVVASLWVIIPQISSYKEFIYALIFISLGIVIKKLLPAS